LRNFQYEFGLEIDGLAGQTTKNKLVKASKYNEQFVKQQINKGNKFTHYGGADLNKQKAPAPSGAKQQNKAPQPSKQPKGTATTPQIMQPKHILAMFPHFKVHNMVQSAS